jgi:hypothetical protein
MAFVDLPLFIRLFATAPHQSVNDLARIEIDSSKKERLVMRANKAAGKAAQ